MYVQQNAQYIADYDISCPLPNHILGCQNSQISNVTRQHAELGFDPVSSGKHVHGKFLRIKELLGYLGWIR